MLTMKEDLLTKGSIEQFQYKYDILFGKPLILQEIFQTYVATKMMSFTSLQRKWPQFDVVE